MMGARKIQVNDVDTMFELRVNDEENEQNGQDYASGSEFTLITE